MPTKYMMDLGADGLSDVMVESPIEIPEIVPGFCGLDLWQNGETPARIDQPGDPVAGRPMAHEPPDGGATFRIIRFMPGESGGRTLDEVKEIHSAIGSVHVPSEEALKTAKHPSMHRTDTLNYLAILSGEVWALSEKRDVLLKPGDVLIQKGCMHGWRNDGDVPCTMMAVLIDSLPPP